MNFGLKRILFMLGWMASVTFFVSCRSEKPPSSILPPEEMTRMIIDVYLAEAQVRSTNFPQDSAIQYFIPFERKWLEEHGQTDRDLLESYNYYLSRPKEFEIIFDAVIDSLSLREQRINHPKDSTSSQP
jgi:Domain of unknown function (DUF4296)